MRKLIVFLFICLTLLSGCGTQDLSGRVEAEIYANPSEVSGKIVEVNASLGATVEKGAILAQIDNTSGRYNYEQLEQSLLQKQAILDGLQSSAEKEAVKQGENAVAIAQKEYETALVELNEAQLQAERYDLLYQSGVVAAKEAEEYQKNLQIAQSNAEIKAIMLDNSKQQLNSLLNTATDSQLRAAVADVELAKSKLAQAEDELDKYTIYAQTAGTIVGSFYRPGEIVTAGSDIADIAAQNEQYVIVYWPNDRLDEITYQQEVIIYTKDHEETGIVKYLDLRQQYTPKEEQNSLNKNKESIKVKILLPENTAFKQDEEVFIKVS